VFIGASAPASSGAAAQQPVRQLRELVGHMISSLRSASRWHCASSGYRPACYDFAGAHWLTLRSLLTWLSVRISQQLSAMRRQGTRIWLVKPTMLI
jgi:hypothetical protein